MEETMPEEMEETIEPTIDLITKRMKDILYFKLNQSDFCSSDILELMEAIKLLKEIENK